MWSPTEEFTTKENLKESPELLKALKELEGDCYKNLYIKWDNEIHYDVKKASDYLRCYQYHEYTDIISNKVAIFTLQIVLESLWFQIGKIDGIYWNETRKWVLAFQKRYNKNHTDSITCDGKPWKETIGKLLVEKRVSDVLNPQQSTDQRVNDILKNGFSDKNYSEELKVVLDRYSTLTGQTSLTKQESQELLAIQKFAANEIVKHGLSNEHYPDNLNVVTDRYSTLAAKTSLTDQEFDEIVTLGDFYRPGDSIHLWVEKLTPEQAKRIASNERINLPNLQTVDSSTLYHLVRFSKRLSLNSITSLDSQCCQTLWDHPIERFDAQNLTEIAMPSGEGLLQIKNLNIPQETKKIIDPPRYKFF